MAGEFRMASSADHMKPTSAELVDLSALADGTLDPARRAEVEARIAASPELSALYERERRVVSALHEARVADRAPAALRARIEASRPQGATAARRRFAYAGGLAGALAAIALALVLVLPGGTPGAPSVSDAAALAVRGPVQGPPVPDPVNPPGRLKQSVGEVYFPNWAKTLGWKAVGARTDSLNGHRAVTVYYDWHGKRVAYTIVDGTLSQPAGQDVLVQNTAMRTFTLGGHSGITWRQSGDTCILLVVSSNHVKPGRLEKLAGSEVPPAR
jgi:hypothetical protein